VTSRRRLIETDTHEWLAKHYQGIFSEIHFAGFWDDPKAWRHDASKADIFQEIGASYLIDDQLKHCLGAAKLGVKGLLFGDYRWNQTNTLPAGVERCVTWADVQDYFEHE